MEDLTYQQFIQQILDSRGRFSCGEEYHERHHIVPRCLGGANGKDNLIDLFSKEHFEAHRLLAKENLNNRDLQFAWYMMCNAITGNQERYKCTPEEYEEAKIAFSNSQKGKSNPMYGKLGELSPRYGMKHSEESKRKMSENRVPMYGADNPFYGKHHTERTKAMMKANHYDCSGENNSFYGKHHTEETKRKISKPVICIETNKKYYGATEAEKDSGIDKSSIIKCCRGKQKTAGGYHWKYADKEEDED